MTAQQFDKDIIFDRATGDYRLTLGGAFIGFARSYVEGEIILDGMITDQLSHGTLTWRIDELKEQYQDAKAAGNHVLAQTVKRALLELYALRLGISVQELIAGYAEYKQEAA